jgi:hypothetical protein
MTKTDKEYIAVSEEAAAAVVELGNSLLERNQEDDLQAVANGVLGGAVQFWLFAHQPCDKPGCQDCEPFSTAELRLRRLREGVVELARSSDYFHSPNDEDVGQS